MPHVEMKLYPGRTEEQKKQCAEKMAEVIAETMGCKLTSVSVTIKEVAQEDWKAEVWDKSIKGDAEHLYKEPGYNMD